jgi:hypothetical protein
MRLQRAVRIDEVSQRGAAKQVHHDPRAAVVLDAAVHIRDSRVAELSRCTSILDAPGAGTLPLILGDPNREDDLLDGDIEAEGFIAGAPDNAHPAGADRLGQPIMPRDQLTCVPRHNWTISQDSSWSEQNPPSGDIDWARWYQRASGDMADAYLEEFMPS